MRFLSAAALSFLLAGGCAHTDLHDGTGEIAQTSATADLVVQNAGKAAPPAAGVGTGAGQQIAPPRVAGGDDVVAIVNGQPITMKQFVPPLVAAHGLAVLQDVILLEMIRQWAVRDHITVTTEDLSVQRKLMLDAMFKDNKPDQDFQDKIAAAEARGDKVEAQKIRDAMNFDREEYVAKLLQEKNLSRTEFDMINEINTYLRKEVEPTIKNSITEDNLRSAFGAMYGEKARALCIMLPNMAQVAVAQRRLSAGDKFEEVARDMSTDPTAKLGGEVRPFTRADPQFPQTLKDATFLLKPDQVSEPISIGAGYILVKLIGKIPPTAVKFENEKETLRALLYNQLLTEKMKDLRYKLELEAAKGLKIEEPTLRKQFQDIQEQQARNREKMAESMERDRVRNGIPTSNPTTNPSAQPLGPATFPGITAPPATQPGTAPAVPRQ